MIDIGLYCISAVASITTGILSQNLLIGINTYGLINNYINRFYYYNIYNGKSDLTPESYRSGYVTRWDRLDYVKSQEGMSSVFDKTQECILLNMIFICMQGI